MADRVLTKTFWVELEPQYSSWSTYMQGFRIGRLFKRDPARLSKHDDGPVVVEITLRVPESVIRPKVTITIDVPEAVEATGRAELQ